MSSGKQFERSYAQAYDYSDLFYPNGDPTDMLDQRKQDVYKEAWCRCAANGGLKAVSHSHWITFFTPPQT
jgi:hypothetical protein